MLCVFAGSTAGTSALVASAAYAVGLKPTITAGGVSPATGPALGGTLVTVTGTNFVANTVAAPNNTTATIGGLPLTNINVATGGTSFTATTPAHSAGGPLLLSVTTPGGTVSTLGATTNKANLFTYTNGIVISPNTAPNSKITGTDVDIQGVGFAAMAFAGTAGSTPSSADAHVYLTNGMYNGQGTTGSGLTGIKTNAPVAECTNVLVVSDTELLCSLNLSMALSTVTGITNSLFTLTRTVPISVTNGSTTITSPSGSFTASDVGSAITVPSNTEFAATTIASVTSATTAVITATPGASNVAVNATITSAAHVPTSGSIGTSTSTATLTGTTGDFLNADVGKVVTGTGIPANTTITAIAIGGASATMSNNGSATGTATDVSISAGQPVPNGAYTLTVVTNGALGANLSDTTFLQSIVSSGSTFTVADY